MTLSMCALFSLNSLNAFGASANEYMFVIIYSRSTLPALTISISSIKSFLSALRMRR